MNTPAHVVLSAVALGRGRHRSLWLPISFGALLPDLPMFGFFFWQRFMAGRSETQIWGELYFDPQWQAFFDAFNSLPLIAIGIATALWLRSPSALAIFFSMTLHCLGDLFVHREDAHAHFFPFTNWHFVSPISYWEPAHYGIYFATAEVVGVLWGSVILVRRGGAWRWIGRFLLALYGIIAIFAIAYWMTLA